MQLYSNYIHFSACVIDNASDPGVTAKNIWIDVVTVREQLCLSFMDNGSGMTPNKLHKMLRCVKTDTNDASGLAEERHFVNRNLSFSLQLWIHRERLQ